MTQQVVVFIDAQNTYMGARDAFFLPTDFHTKGNFHPVKLGSLLAARRPPGTEKEERQPKQVRIYTGEPTSRDPKGYSASRRRHAVWENGGAIVVARPLRYPPAYPREKPKEKGIDVSLAVDLVVFAIKGEYDVGIVVSNDTDLRPAVEAVKALTDKRVEIVVWKGCGPLDTPSKDLWCHRLGYEDYESVADWTDYNVPALHQR